MPELASKLACVVDTSALRHWKDIELNNLPLDDWLEREFDVRTSRTIVDEIDRQKRYWGKPARRARKKARRWMYILQNPEQAESVLLTDFVDRNLINTVEGAGERRNFCVTVDLVRKDKFRHVIFLTDDDRATEDFLKDAFSVFNVACVWNSLDLVLYLYIRHKSSMPLPVVKNVVRDLIANFTKDAANVSKLQSRLADYYVRLERISTALGKMPL